MDVFERCCTSTGRPLQRFVAAKMIMVALLNIGGERIDEGI